MNENATFLSGVVSQLTQHFNQDDSPFDYHLDFIKTICDFPVKVFIKFSPMNESTHFTTYSLYIIHPKLKVCLCGDRYILYFKNYGGTRLNNITNQTIFDIFYRITNEIPLLRFDTAKGCLTLEPPITEQLVFFNKLITATNITCLYCEECCVCYNKTQTTLKCGHICCLACLSKLNDKKCPMCRVKITTVNVPENLISGYRKRFFGSVECESGSDDSENEEEEGGEDNPLNYIQNAEEAEGSNNPANYSRVIPANHRLLLLDSQIPEEDTQYGRNAIMNTLRNAVDTAIQDELLFSINPFQDRDEQDNATGVYDTPIDNSIDRIDNYGELEPTENDTAGLNDTNLDDELTERLTMGENDRRA